MYICVYLYIHCQSTMAKPTDVSWSSVGQRTVRQRCSEDAEGDQLPCEDAEVPVWDRKNGDFPNFPWKKFGT